MNKKLLSKCTIILAIALIRFSAYSQSTRAYITNFNDSTLSVIDVDNQIKIGDVVTGKNPHGVDISPDGKWLGGSNEGSNTVSILNTTTNKVVKTIGLAITLTNCRLVRMGGNFLLL